MASSSIISACSFVALLLNAISSPSVAAILHHLVASDVPTISQCPLMTDAPVTQIVEAQLVPSENGSNACQRILECNILTSPPETIVYWYRNGEMVHASAVRDVTLRSGGLTDEPILGLASIRHRICADSLIQQGTHHTFVCRAQSVCDPRDVAEGPPVVVEATDESKTNETNNAPMITYATTTRMELAGNFVQLSCRTDISPLPEIQWFLVDSQDEQTLLPIENFRLFWKLTDWDVIVDTSKLQDASVTLQCRATNTHGSDSATLTLVLLTGP